MAARQAASSIQDAHEQCHAGHRIEPTKLGSDAPHGVIAKRESRSGEALGPAAECGRMSDDRVAGDGFHEHDLLRRVELRQKCLHAAAIAQEFRVVAGKSLTLSMIQRLST